MKTFVPLLSTMAWQQTKILPSLPTTTLGCSGGRNHDDTIPEKGGSGNRTPSVFIFPYRLPKWQHRETNTLGVRLQSRKKNPDGGHNWPNAHLVKGPLSATWASVTSGSCSLMQGSLTTLAEKILTLEQTHVMKLNGSGGNGLWEIFSSSKDTSNFLPYEKSQLNRELMLPYFEFLDWSKLRF